MSNVFYLRSLLYSYPGTTPHPASYFFICPLKDSISLSLLLCFNGFISVLSTDLALLKTVYGYFFILNIKYFKRPLLEVFAACFQAKHSTIRQGKIAI